MSNRAVTQKKARSESLRARAGKPYLCFLSGRSF